MSLDKEPISVTHRAGPGSGPHPTCIPPTEWSRVFGNDLADSVAELLFELHPLEVGRINLQLALTRAEALAVAYKTLLLSLDRSE